MAATLGFLAAVVSTGFLLDLGSSYLERPRPHIGAWVVAIGMYAIASWLLFIGLQFGWNGPVFRTYYWLGAIVNVPVLAIGSVYLNFGRKAGHASAVLMALAAIWTAWVVYGTDVHPDVLTVSGVARGSEVFADRSPAILAGIFSPLGALVVAVLSAVAAVRSWGRLRGLALGNLLIVLAIVVLSVGGVKSTVAGGALLAGTLSVGAALLWIGYRVATGARGLASEPTSA